ncbi:hypothetical protein C0V77_22405 [Emticicia sp. TH156]|nr:hypothetical protein C0V77_22405 [Emticicia sp. TH156]
MRRISFGARTYNASIGRFDGVDELAEISESFSHFVYANNNPLRFVDPDGMASEDFTYSDGFGTLSARNTTGSVGFIGSYNTTDDDKNKDKSKENKSIALPIGVTGGTTLSGTLSRGLSTGTTLSGTLTRALPAAAGAGAVDGPLPVGVAIGVGILVGVAADYYRRNLNNKVYVTYTKTNFRTGQVYVGRTSGNGNKLPQQVVKERDYGHKYWDNLGFGPARVDRFLYGSVSTLPVGISEAITISAYSAIRGREQNLYDYFNSKGLVANRILPIGPYNPFRSMYLKSSAFVFGKIK